MDLLLNKPLGDKFTAENSTIRWTRVKYTLDELFNILFRKLIRVAMVFHVGKNQKVSVVLVNYT